LGTTNNIENFSDIVATMMMQNGADLRNPSGKEAEETLIFYRKFADPTDPSYTWNESLDNSIFAFATSRVAMILAPSWRAFDIKEMSKINNPSLRFKIVPIPQLPGNTVSWASYWVEGVSSKSKYPVQAWKFIQYLTSREGESKLYLEASKNRLFGEPYSRAELSGSVTGDDYVEAYIKQAPNSKSFPLASRTFDNGLNDKLIKYLEDALNSVSKGTAPSQALEIMSKGFHQVFTTYGLSSGTAAPARRDPTIQ
jgi:multiple sugar transport system substrate-binding protein